LSYFDFGLMGAVKTGYNGIIILVDFMWVRLKDSKGIPFTDAMESVNVTEEILTPKVGYRVVDKSGVKADAVAIEGHRIPIRLWTRKSTRR
jgi:hypothetical protein